VVGSSLSKRPKRLFHAIVACGVTITACGSTTTTGGDGGTSDATSDAKNPKDASSNDGSVFPSDAQDEADAFDPPDVIDNDSGTTIKPPPPTIH
jgi:hypothetical protein